MTRSHFKLAVASIAASLALSVSGFFGIAPAYADGIDTHLLVSPASQSLGELEPGNTYSGEFLVKNIGNNAFSYRVYIAPYYVQGDDYNPTYETMNSYTHISEWFSFDREGGSLDVQEQETVKYTVKVPLDVPGGAQNAAIMVETDSSVDETKTVSSSTRIAMLVYSTVNGDTRVCGKIIEKSIPAFLFHPPISASGRVENCGNTDLDVTYTFRIYSFFSNEEIYSNEEKPVKLATLPETRRYTNLEWEGTPSFGIFKAKLDVNYAGKTETIEKIVIICPLWLVVLIIVFIGAVIFWLVSRNRERKINKRVEE